MLDDVQRLVKLGSWERDLKTGSYHWSDEMFRLHGYQPQSFRPTPTSAEQRMHPGDVPKRRRWLEALLATPGIELAETFRLNMPNGDERVVRAVARHLPAQNGASERIVGTLQDVTDDIRARHAQALLGQIVESTSDAIYTLDQDGRITSWNPSAERLFGYSAQEAIGASIELLLPRTLDEDGRRIRLDRVRRLLDEDGVSEEFEDRRRHKDGRLVDVLIVGSSLRDFQGGVIGLVASVRDISERRRTEARVAHLANHDPVTGLFNRKRFEEAVSETLARVRHERVEGAVIMLDLDYFKFVNEAFGHSTGDALVAVIARALAGRLRETDVLARLGGDEFGVLCAPIDNLDAERLGADVLETVRSQAIAIGDQSVRVTASVGICAFGAGTTTVEELLADVDHATYESKEAGRNRVTMHGDQSRASRRRLRSGIEQRLRHALTHDEFELHVQPIVTLQSGGTESCEVLVRMRRDGELIFPGHFLPAAARLGLTREIDHWVIDHALELAAVHPELTFFVNLSGQTIDDDGLDLFIAERAAAHACDPSRLVFELTETAAVGNISRARELASKLAELGCRFAIDDFGAGFSTFYYLKHFPADFIKIDGEFVSGPRSPTDDLVIESIVRIAANLGKRTIAEFVADEETMERMCELGVDLAQGYYFSKPFPSAQLASLGTKYTGPPLLA
jgi:diguanylate cyclase (GGDEF)-like protein/PAS domain S-box-containing protein